MELKIEICNKITKETSEETFKIKLSVFLRKLLNNVVVENFKQTENSFDEFTKKISIYLFYTAGRLAYETLNSNLKNSLPSISTLNRYIENKSLQLEGDFDFQGLSEFLERRDLPKLVWISEEEEKLNMTPLQIKL